MGLPYVLSSDLVSAYPAKSLEIAQYVDGLIPLLAMTQNAQTGTTYTFVLTDFTKLVTLSNASAVAVTLPLESSVAWPAGTQLRLLNLGAGTVTVAGAVGVTISGTPLTLAQFKGANLIKTGTNTWVMLPFASGVGAAVFSDTPTGTYTGYAYKTFAASGTLTVTVAGFADIVLCGGGAGSSAPVTNYGGGGGAGGVLPGTLVYLPVGTLTVTVGAGGAGGTAAAPNRGTAGNASRLGDFYGIGGGEGAERENPGGNGASGGGGTGSDSAAGRTSGAGVSGQGFAGGAGGTNLQAGGGGGGASAVGATFVTTTGGDGGAGTTTSIAGTTPTGAYVAGSYALGGGGGGAGASVAGAGGSGGGGAGVTSGVGTAGTVNKGGGAGGSKAPSAGAAGGSGIVIVRVAV